MKKLLAAAVILTAGPMTNGSAFAQPESMKLFDATAALGTGPNAPPSEAIVFGSIPVILNIQPGDTYTISRTADPADPEAAIVIDNFMTINGIQNICENISGQAFPDSCFGEEVQPSGDPGVVGMPIEDVLMPVGPVDVTWILSALPRGTNRVVFELRDFGTVAGNTDLFLVISGPGGGSPAGGFGTAVGPDLEVRLEFGSFTVSNVGDQRSGETAGFFSLAPSDPFNPLFPPRFSEIFVVPALDPDDAELFILPIEGCPPEEGCVLYIQVELAADEVNGSNNIFGPETVR